MNLFENLSKLFDRSEWERIIIRSVKETLSEVEDLQTEQFSYGLNSEGKEIGVLRNDDYAKQKKARGGKAPFGVPDLYAEGDFYSKVTAKIQAKFISITSTDNKTKELEQKYNQNGDLFPLNQEYINKYVEILVPYIQDNLFQWLQSNLSQLQ